VKFEDWCKNCIICGKKEKISNNCSDIEMIEVATAEDIKYLPFHMECFKRIPEMDKITRERIDIECECDNNDSLEYDDRESSNPKKLQEYCKPRGEDYQYYNIDEVIDCIKVWIKYLNELGDFFEKEGQQERADRHYSQAIVMEMLIGKEG
jgi:hypothetical protein